MFIMEMVQDIFYETGKDKNILFMSLHYKNELKGHFEHTGKYGININIPFPFQHILEIMNISLYGLILLFLF